MNRHVNRHMDRRSLLQGALATSALAALPNTRVQGQQPIPSQGLLQQATNPIVIENNLPGTREWLLDKPRIDPTTRYRCPWIEAYCSHTSIRAGQTLRIYVSTNPESKFELDVFRLGYYRGDGGRLMRSMGPFVGKVQADPEVG
ncbi:MAG: twin-arginine translocation signal domain-containing protein, partial [Planctomycetales bacterium]|nr:twin-arginine translocation signal domain-containing protein [Planctomycetales bacterium]